ncbi:hypothetical protein C8Q76DRAFT_623114, partial [Earliella scabrosa]
SDGLVGAMCCRGTLLVTSPNVEYVPDIVQGVVTVRLRQDFRYGITDPLQWPQVYTSRFGYMAAVSLPNDTSSPYSIMWTRPRETDFVPLTGSPVSTLGTLRKTFVHDLATLVADLSARVRAHQISHPDHLCDDLLWHDLAMRQALDRLQHTSATFMDQQFQVAELQRHWILATAYLRFQALSSSPPSPTSPELQRVIGAWTCDPGVVRKLRDLGIPVWLVRLPAKVPPGSVKIRRVTRCFQPSSICHVPLDNVNNVYEGLAGERHLAAMLNSGHSYLDVALNASSRKCDLDQSLEQHHTPSSSSRTNGSQRTVQRYQPCTSSITIIDYSKVSYQRLDDSHSRRCNGRSPHPSQVRGRDKFQDVNHPFMPAALDSWARAMREVDRSAPAKTGIWGYWIPEPGLLVGPQEPIRVERYLMNWLRVREAWLYKLRMSDLRAPNVSSQSWRTFFNGVPDDPTNHTRSGRRIREIQSIFGDSFGEATLDPSTQAPVCWFQHVISRVSDSIAPVVLWEMFELGFCYELLALDRFLRPMFCRRDEARREESLSKIFPGNDIHAVVTLPTVDSCGLFARNPHRRVQALNAFRDILLRWAWCPAEIIHSPPLRSGSTIEDITTMEHSLASFYVSQFFNAAGRAPLVPHLAPLSYGT